MAPSRPVENKLPTNRQLELQFAADCGLSLSQVDPYGDAPLPSLAVAFNYVPGGPMVPPEVAKDLPTWLRSLNNWYDKVVKRGQTQFFFMAGKDHFLGQDHAIPIEFRELFQFFNPSDIDVTIVSAYSL